MSDRSYEAGCFHGFLYGSILTSILITIVVLLLKGTNA